ncbi:hypothetical protein AB0N88_24375 [Streptomyces sp. NPDC093516]|uniref:hypothetical protein n=1 Tax=Streptomyces sp. NPDC093516 TaxID=3155304 RepID=UPI0034209D26
MEDYALRRDHVDWDGTRRAAFAEAGNARRPADTYPAIRTALIELGDGHSALFDPQGAEEMSGDEQVRQPVEGRTLRGRVGYLSPPAVGGSEKVLRQHVREGRDAVAKADRPEACGWVVDLRPFAAGPIPAPSAKPPQASPPATYGTGCPTERSLNLTEVKDADRTGRTYDSPIPPDQPVVDNPGRRGGEDPVMSAAVTWLSRQPGCSME